MISKRYGKIATLKQAKNGNLKKIKLPFCLLARGEGLEPPTLGFGDRYSTN